MRKIWVAFFLHSLILLNVQTSAQQTTFYEPYPQFQSIYNLIDDLHSSYYFFTYNYVNNTSQRFLCKTNYYGTLDWAIDIGSDYQGNVYLSENFTPMWANFSSGEMILNEVTPDGYISTRKVYSSNNYLSNAKLIRFDDGKFAAIYLSKIGTTQYFYNAIILDENFQYIKSINFNNGNISNSGALSTLIKLNDRYAFVGMRELLMINSNNEKISYIKFNDEITSAQKIDDNYFYIAFKNRVCKYSKDGALIKTTEIPFYTNYARLVDNNDGTFLVVTDKFTLIDSDGNIIWQKNVGGFYMSIIRTSDGGYLCATNGLLKLDQNLSASVFLGLSINSKIITGTKEKIRWSSVIDGIGVLEFSKDGISNWQKIANVNLRDASYGWDVPYETTDNAKLRLNLYGTNRTIYSNSFQIILDTETANKISVNNIKYYYKTNGIVNFSSVAPLYWLDDFNQYGEFLYSEGLMWAGNIENELRAGGASFSSGLQPGNIISLNQAANQSDNKFKSWKYNTDWDNFQDTLKRNNFKYDFYNWPVDLGAPWIDQNRNGNYEPESGDRPKTEADEIHWMVMNDLDSTKCKKFLGSKPIGLEAQLSIYAYKNKYPNVVFKNYLIINKSNKKISDMYFSYFSDDDLGVTSSNYIGCDSTLGLSYTYCTSDRLDYVFGAQAPSIGHMLLQGPIIKSSASNQAIFKGNIKSGYKNINATSLSGSMKSMTGYIFDPPSDANNYQATVQTYNIMKGLHNYGNPVINPLTNKPAVFHFSGDPETGTGWLNNISAIGTIIPSDKRYYVNVGPFTMEPQDTQEIVVAILIAKGISNANSVTELKKLATSIRDYYYSKILTSVDDGFDELPTSYKLFQNYPNPFNPETKIKFYLPTASKVTITLFDLLGRKVTDLTNDFLTSGLHEINFSAKILNISSGIYFYRFIANDFIQVKKMILLK